VAGNRQDDEIPGTAALPPTPRSPASTVTRSGLIVDQGGEIGDAHTEQRLLDIPGVALAATSEGSDIPIGVDADEEGAHAPAAVRRTQEDSVAAAALASVIHAARRAMRRLQKTVANRRGACGQSRPHERTAGSGNANSLFNIFYTARYRSPPHSVLATAHSGSRPRIAALISLARRIAARNAPWRRSDQLPRHRPRHRLLPAGSNPARPSDCSARLAVTMRQPNVMASDWTHPTLLEAMFLAWAPPYRIRRSCLRLRQLRLRLGRFGNSDRNASPGDRSVAHRLETAGEGAKPTDRCCGNPAIAGGTAPPP